MTTVPLGIHAYKRTFGGEPEIKLINRFVEADPSNLRERTALLSRAGTKLLAYFYGINTLIAPRGLYSKPGLFNNDLFVVTGTSLYRYSEAGVRISISSDIGGTGRPFMVWDRGSNYQRMFISDGQLLSYYDGGSHATGILTSTVTPTNQILQIGTTYYGWNASVNANSPNGTATNPFLCKFGTDPMLSMANMLNFVGVRGTDFSTVIGGPSTVVTAVASGGSPATILTLSAISDGTDANTVATAVFSGAAGLSWGAATLLGGGNHALFGVAVPTGEGISALANLNHFIMCAVTNSQKIFYLRPASVTMGALDFASKESNPDPVVDMITAGDFVYVIGSGSTEVWYATGQNASPLGPVLGRTAARGALAGTAVNIRDDIFLVGDDGVVYSMLNGPVRISDHAIEERIRTQLRREKGLT